MIPSGKSWMAVVNSRLPRCGLTCGRGVGYGSDRTRTCCNSSSPHARTDRIVPLIVAVALFMENMDSTVIATSLPAIAADIGTNPLALKLAITSYLLSLAIFIPASGWTADRFGARTVFRAAIAVFVIGSIGCALSGSLTDFVDRAHRAGHRRRDDDAGRPPGDACAPFRSASWSARWPG